MDSFSTDKVELVSMVVAGQLVGIPVEFVEDVLGPQKITRVPRAAPEIAGVLNLRGRIVTVVDLRTRLGLPKTEDCSSSMSVVVDHHGELYSLRVDEVGEVLQIAFDDFDRSLVSLKPSWRDVAVGIFQIKTSLLIQLDIAKILSRDLAA